MSQTRRVTNLALLVSVGLVLSIIESMFPPLLPVPGARLGLANIATVIALYLFGPVMALEVAVLRSLLSGLIRGSVVGLFLGFTGSVLSTLVMAMLFLAAGRLLSVIGVSVAGAVVHNSAQLGAAFLLVGQAELFYFLPLLVLLAVPTGLFVGFASRRVASSLEPLSTA